MKTSTRRQPLSSARVRAVSRPRNLSTLMRALAAAGCCLLPPGAAFADDSDAIRFLIGETVTYDDNVFRLSDDSQSRVESRSDVIFTTYAGVLFDKQYSRQKLHAELIGNVNRYTHNSDLNNNGSSANAKWGWELGNRLKGVLSYEQSRKLIDFGNLNPNDRGSRRDVNTYQRFYASGDWWFHPEFSYGAAYARVASRYSSEERRASAYDADVFELNAKFQPKTGNLIGLTARDTKGKYPNREVFAGSVFAVDNSYDQRDYEVNGDWQLTGQSKVSGRLGYTTRDHDQVSQRDFSGVTGRVAYNWALEGKTSVTVAARREIGAVEDVNASYVVTDGISVSPTWITSAKTQLSGKLDWRKRRYQGDPTGFLSGVPGFELRRDNVRTASVTGTYLPLRNLQLSLTLQREQRTSNIRFADYDDNLASLSAQFSF